MLERSHAQGNIKIRQTMRGLVAECCDAATGEASCTNLAEFACAELDGYEAGHVPEAYFECAYEVGREYERKQGGASAMPSALAGIVNARESDWL